MLTFQLTTRFRVYARKEATDNTEPCSFPLLLAAGIQYSEKNPYFIKGHFNDMSVLKN